MDALHVRLPAKPGLNITRSCWYGEFMVATLELKSLSIPERLLLVEDIWDSIEEEQHALADHPSVIGEIRARKNKFISNPSSGISWEVAKERIRNGLA